MEEDEESDKIVELTTRGLDGHRDLIYRNLHGAHILEGLGGECWRFWNPR